jgi:starvation-inducible DNA-binding protein
MEVRIGLSPAQHQGVMTILTKLLADEYVLYTKTRKYHWNVVGPQFNEQPTFFETQFNELNIIADDVAEHARLTEDPGWHLPASDMLAKLLVDHETMIHQLRVDLETCANTYPDASTNDFLTGLLAQHEKMAWTLREFLADAAV